MIKFKLIFITIIAFMQANIFAQSNAIPSTIVMYPLFTGEVDMVSDNLDFAPQLNYLEVDPEKENEALQEIQVKKTQEKLEYLKESGLLPYVSDKKNRATDPIYIRGWKSNSGTGTPSDNAIAVNTLGQIVSMVNSNVIFYNDTGKNIYLKSMSAFFKENLVTGALTGTNSNQCDPKVIFDCEKKRFIAFSMTCTGSSATSRIILAISKEEDVTKGWYNYVWNTDAFAQGVWFDYPRLGVNANDIFVTGNMFTNGGSFDEVYMFQIDKTVAYNATALPKTIIHRNLPNNPFTLTSVNQGLCTALPTNHFLVSTNAGANNSSSLALWEVTGKASDVATPTITRRALTTSLPYSVPGFAVQQGSSIVLKTGDSRTHDAIMINGVIHVAFNYDAGNGFSGIHYNRITKSGTTWTVQSKAIKATNKEFAYPTLASFANLSHGGTDQGVFLGFCSSAANEYPSIKAMNIDNSMTLGNIITVKAGSGVVTYLTDTINSFVTTRWGDYIGACRQHNALVPTVWVHGLHGDGSNIVSKNWNNFIAKFTSVPEYPTSAATITNNNSVYVYPNPAVNNETNIIFNANATAYITISIVDLQGKQVAQLLNGYVYPGKNGIIFNTNALNSGTYFVQIKDNNKNITLQNTKLLIP